MAHQDAMDVEYQWHGQTLRLAGHELIDRVPVSGELALGSIAIGTGWSPADERERAVVVDDDIFDRAGGGDRVEARASGESFDYLRRLGPKELLAAAALFDAPDDADDLQGDRRETIRNVGKRAQINQSMYEPVRLAARSTKFPESTDSLASGRLGDGTTYGRWMSRSMREHGRGRAVSLDLLREYRDISGPRASWRPGTPGPYKSGSCC